MKEAYFSFSHLQLSTSGRRKVQDSAEKCTLTKIISVYCFSEFQPAQTLHILSERSRRFFATMLNLILCRSRDKTCPLVD